MSDLGLPDLPIVHLASFDAYCKRTMVDGKTGELQVTLAIPLAQKYDAIKLSDYPGQMFRVSVEREDFDAWGMTDESAT